VSAYRFIAAERANHPVALMCRVLGVSRSGFYDWCSRPPSKRELDDRSLTVQIRRIHLASRRTYGAPRITAELRSQGVVVSRKRVARLMQAARIQGIHQRRPWRSPKPAALSEVPDLVGRRFTAEAPDRIWAADITYIATRSGWGFLAVVLDLHSRRVVGWHLGHSLKTEAALRALDEAIARRRPAPGLVHHSDHGTQYTSRAFAERLERAGIRPSMGSLRSAYDNAVVESFFATLKREHAHGRRFTTIEGARSSIGGWIEGFYNAHRRHSALHYLSPVEFERQAVDGTMSTT
jgi:putative transposase